MNEVPGKVQVQLLPKVSPHLPGLLPLREARPPLTPPCDDAEYIEQKRQSRELQAALYAIAEEGRRRYGKRYGKSCGKNRPKSA